ncbi:MAG: TIM barrel protein [Phycisphaera sp.]|nr:TIM barrel protein [Phycisphaera sp.]
MHRFTALSITLTLCLTAVASAQDKADAPFAPAFYAFENGVAFGDVDNEAKTLKELGYDGISQVHGGSKLAERVAAYEKVGLKVLSVYLNVDDKPITAEQVQPLADRGAMIELTIHKMTPGTVDAVRQTAEMASKLNIRVALYPHFGMGVATIPQALDLIDKVNHPNLGVMFNLCHYLRGEKAGDLEATLDKAAPHLFAVSTCGADTTGKGWGDLIKPLDQGDFPQARLFGTLKKLHFTGPVGLQCYAVKGDKRTNLEHSMTAWKKILSEL